MDQSRAKRLFDKNYNLVYEALKRFKGKGLPDDDIMQEAAKSLWYAATHFKPAKKTKFSSWAIQIINSGVRRALMQSVRLIRLPYYKECQRVQDIRNGKTPYPIPIFTAETEEIHENTQDIPKDNITMWEFISSIPEMDCIGYYILYNIAKNNLSLKEISATSGLDIKEIKNTITGLKNYLKPYKDKLCELMPGL